MLGATLRVTGQVNAHIARLGHTMMPTVHLPVSFAPLVSTLQTRVVPYSAWTAVLEATLQAVGQVTARSVWLEHSLVYLDPLPARSALLESTLQTQVVPRSVWTAALDAIPQAVGQVNVHSAQLGHTMVPVDPLPAYLAPLESTQQTLVVSRFVWTAVLDTTLQAVG